MTSKTNSKLRIQAVLISVVLAIVTFIAEAELASLLGGSNVAASLCVLIAGLAVGIFATSSQSCEDTAPELQTIYVGNLPYKANEHAVRQLFSEHGRVYTVRLMKDKQTGRRRGYGFVEMAQADATKAIGALNETEFQQRTLKVREAKERKTDASQ